jgi:hypothetical protein
VDAKEFIYVQNRGNAIELDQTAPLSHLNIDYLRMAKRTLRDEPREDAMTDFKAAWERKPSSSSPRLTISIVSISLAKPVSS